MNNQQHALLKLSEECNEVAQMCSKIIQFGLDSIHEYKTNRERLTEELNDLLACIEYLKLNSDFEFNQSIEAKWDKIEKMDYYKECSKNIGLVQK